MQNLGRERLLAGLHPAQLEKNPKRESRLVRFARSRPLVLFFVLAYTVAWLSWLPLVLSRSGLGLIPVDVPIEYCVVGGFAPSLAALLTHWLAEQNLRAFRLYDSLNKLLLGALVGPVLIVTAFVVVPGLLMTESSLGTLNWRVFSSLAIFNWSTLFGGPLGEEPGWRGYALPRLQTSFGPFLASLTLGLLWVAWHLPMFLVRGWVSVSVGIFAVVAIAATFLMTYGANISGFSVIVAVMMHAAFNTCSKLLNGLLVSAKVRESPPPEAIFALSSLAMALAVLGFTRGRLGVTSPNRHRFNEGMHPTAQKPGGG